MIKRLLLTASMLVSFTLSSVHFAFAEKDNVNSFWIGHSLIGHDIPFLVGAIAESLNKTYQKKSQITNGAPLKCNWNDCGQLQGVNAREYLPSSEINSVIMTEAVPLQNHLDWSQTYEYAQKYYELAQQTVNGSDVYLYETWHCITSGTEIECPWDGNTHIPWRERLTSDLTKWQGIIEQVKINIPSANFNLIPAGQAMAAMHDAIENGEFNGFSHISDLYVDDIHLNDLGAYYISLVQFATLFRMSPVNAVYENIYNPERWYTYQSPTSEQAQKMQQLAWQVVSDFYPAENRAVGMNVTSPSYWSSEWMFVDLVKRASGGTGNFWVTLCNGCNGNWWDTNEQDALQLNAQGWPTSLPDESDPNHDFFAVGTILLNDDNTQLPSGEYVVLYEGEGDLSFHWGASVDTAQSTNGRMVLNVHTPENGLFMRINQTNSENPLRNIQVLMPGGICNNDPFHYAESASDCAGNFQSFENLGDLQPFHPLFLQRLKPFSSVRFMQYLDIVTSQITSWENRAQPDFASYATEQGAPIEPILQLANTLQVRPWLNVPARVDNHYIQQYMTLVKQLLDPNLSFYLEYYNEPWNTAWPYYVNANWLRQQGEQAWTDPNVHWYQKQINWYGTRAQEICQIAKQVFSEQPERVCCVMGGFAANAWTSHQALECPLHSATGGSACYSNFYGLAIAPYFGGYLQNNALIPTLVQWTQESDGGLNRLFQELEFGGLYDDTVPGNQPAPEGGALNQAIGFMTSHKPLSTEYNLKLLAYEGGQHLSMNGNLSGDRALVNPLFLNANRDTRMGTLSKLYLDAWQSNGGDLFMWFESVGRYGAWGAFPVLEYQNQLIDSAPKYKALLEWISGH